MSFVVDYDRDAQGPIEMTIRVTRPLPRGRGSEVDREGGAAPLRYQNQPPDGTRPLRRRYVTRLP